LNSIPVGSGPIVLLDNGDFRRTGFCEEIKQAQSSGQKVLNIDHHPKNDLWKIANINYADETASSTCEILYRLFGGLGMEITPEIATALLAGIFYDTGGFHHSNTCKAVLEIVSDLLRRGGKLKKIADKIGGNRSVPMLKLWGIALSRLRLNNAGVSVSVLTREDIESTKATEEEISGLINLLNSAPESRIALLLHETLDGKIKGSLRTENDAVDVAQLAKLLGGGGHKKAAGFTIDGRIKIEGKDWKVI